MRTLWCWRCRTDIPMLDEDEWQRVAPLLTADIRGIKAYRTEHRASLGEALKNAQLAGRTEYERITGFHSENPNSIWHHRVTLYGPPCNFCEKPLRTPRARHCAACGRERAG